MFVLPPTTKKGDGLGGMSDRHRRRRPLLGSPPPFPLTGPEASPRPGSGLGECVTPFTSAPAPDRVSALGGIRGCANREGV